MSLSIVTSEQARALPEHPDQAERPPLVAPVHGHGKLYRGGVRGHRGGTGRRPDKVRRALLAVASIGVAEVLKPLIEGHSVRVIGRDGSVIEIDPSWADRLRAVEIALKYALGAAQHADAEIATRTHARIRYVEPVEPVDPPYIVLPKLGSSWEGVDINNPDAVRIVEGP